MATASIDEDSRLPERPIGALITSIQAVCTIIYFFLLFTFFVLFQVHRVLLYSTGGSFKPPRSKSGAFSKANWGDYDAASQRGTTTTVKRASVFLKRIQGLKDQQWEDIYKTALENHELGKLVDSADGDEQGSDDSNDDELLDPLYDEMPVSPPASPPPASPPPASPPAFD